MNARQIDEDDINTFLGLHKHTVAASNADGGQRVNSFCHLSPQCPRGIGTPANDVNNGTSGMQRSTFGEQVRESEARRTHQKESLPDSYDACVTVALFLDRNFRTTDEWLSLLSLAMPNEKVALISEIDDFSSVDVALVRGVDPGNLRVLPSLAFVQCLWAGVERLLNHPDIPNHLPLARMVDPAMAVQMANSVAAHVLDIYLQNDVYRHQQAARVWQPHHLGSAAGFTVGILGLGALGRECATMLRALGFGVIGWRASARELTTDANGTRCSHELADITSTADVIVNLLPLTPQTVGILKAEFFDSMKPGASIINVARGGHLVDDDLLRALTTGRVRRAVLDVFSAEPLSRQHPFWTHPAITITPHIAAETDPGTASAVIAENVRAWRSGGELTGLVDRSRAY